MHKTSGEPAVAPIRSLEHVDEWRLACPHVHVILFGRVECDGLQTDLPSRHHTRKCSCASRSTFFQHFRIADGSVPLKCTRRFVPSLTI